MLQHIGPPLERTVDWRKIVRDHRAWARILALERATKGLGMYVTEEDLCEAAEDALMEAAQRWDPNLGAFKAYARVRIRGAMLDKFRNASPTSRGSYSMCKAVAEKGHELRHAGQTVREFTREEVLEALEIGEEKVERARGGEIQVSSVEDMKKYDDEQERTIEFDIPDLKSLSAISEFEEAHDFDSLIRDRPELSERDRLILMLYFVEAISLKKIGGIMGVTEGRISQLMKKALGKMRVSAIGMIAENVEAIMQNMEKTQVSVAEIMDEMAEGHAYLQRFDLWPQVVARLPDHVSDRIYGVEDRGRRSKKLMSKQNCR